VEKAQDFVDAGVTLFTVGTGGPDYDLTELTEAVTWRNDRR
ncbi:MAG: LLM class F420-dependent oxidoreductase, partial [Rhodococcus sp. (in: high G+C Gram-positive bacteria)]